MPIYEYPCVRCGHVASLLRSMSEASAPVTCPNCGMEGLVRTISRVSILKSDADRARDVSWIDRDLARRLKKKSGGRLSPDFKDTLDRMESS